MKKISLIADARREFCFAQGRCAHRYGLRRIPCTMKCCVSRKSRTSTGAPRSQTQDCRRMPD